MRISIKTKLKDCHLFYPPPSIPPTRGGKHFSSTLTDCDELSRAGRPGGGEMKWTNSLSLFLYIGSIVKHIALVLIKSRPIKRIDKFLIILISG